MELTLEQAKRLLTQYQAEYADIKRQGIQNKYLHDNYIMDIGNLSAFIHEKEQSLCD